MSVKDKIEALPRFSATSGMLGQGYMRPAEGGEYLTRADVLRSAPADEALPAWRRELQLMQARWDSLQDEQKHPCELYSALQSLKVLDKLRVVILSGRGEAAVPEGVARACGKESAHGPGRWMHYHGGAVSLFRLVDGRHCAGQDILTAIDSHGNSLVTP